MHTVLLGAAALCCGACAVEYRVDDTWLPEFPLGTGSYAAVDVAVGIDSASGLSAAVVFVGQRNTSYKDPVLVFDEKGRFIDSFGANDVAKGVHHGAANWGVHGINVHTPTGCTSGDGRTTVWVTDFVNHTVVAFDASLWGLLQKTGDGASSDLDKFDSPADLAFHCDGAFLVDGDGGANMRVSGWRLANGLLDSPTWAVPAIRPAQRKAQEFDHPHSICWHEATSQLVVADRDHHRIVFMDPETGAVTGDLACDLALGPGSHQGRPFGVRAFRRGDEDLLLVAVAGNEGVETNRQVFHVLDASGFSQGRCSVLQSLDIDPERCHTPHLLGLNSESGDVYVACNQQPNSNVLRLTRIDSLRIEI